jgi:Mrp family chromosome partitioning ATPase
VTSALEGEGKSTTAANLAIAFARDGCRTVLVDLDLRRPRLAEQFGIFGPGITDVALGQAELAEALVPVELEMGDEEHAGANGDAHRHTRELENHGELLVLPSGFIPALAGEFLGTSRIAEILSAVGDQADVVIIDSPPMMRVGDVLALSPKLDGLLLLARLDVVRRPMLADLRRMLEAAPITKLGVVVAAPGDEGNLGYYGYAYGERTPSSRSKRRPVKIRG